MTRAPVDIVVPLIFARGRAEALAAPVSRPGVAVWPMASSGWNDFGHNFSVRGAILEPGETVHDFELKLMFEGGGYTFRRLTEWLANSPGWLPAAAIETSFCTLLPSMDAYRDLVAACGFSLAISVLRSTRLWCGRKKLTQPFGEADVTCVRFQHQTSQTQRPRSTSSRS